MAKQKQPTIDLTDDDFGAVLTCAVRYAIGRQTYMPKLVIDYITPLLPYLNGKALWCFEKDVASPWMDNWGDEKIDKPEWMKFLSDVRAEIEGRKSKPVEIDHFSEVK